MTSSTSTTTTSNQNNNNNQSSSSSSSSTPPSAESSSSMNHNHNNHYHQPKQIDRLIIIDQELADNQHFVDTLKETFQITIEVQTELSTNDKNENHLHNLQNGIECSTRNTLEHQSTSDNGENVLYISSSFQGPLFEKLLSERKHIISDIVVEHCFKERISLPIPKYPLFNYFMKDFVICFSVDDKRKTRIVNRYLNLIRFMCGQSRRDMKSGKSYERTHLIESKTGSVNYNLACIYAIPILYKEWIDYFWEHRRDQNFNPNDESIYQKYRIKPLADLRIALYNYPQEELIEKTKLIIEYGGHSVPLYETNTTHLVVNNHENSDYINILDNYSIAPLYVVSEKWIDSTINFKYRDQEDNYLLRVPLNNEKSGYAESTPTKDELNSLNSILLSPNYDNSIDSSSIADKNDLKKQAITQELYQTELNYVKILNDIIKIFRDPLKNHQRPDQFPNEIELKTIFGGLPPIIHVHQQILDELEPVVKNWKAENEIGKIFQKHSQDFLTVYPQYVNFYEKTKETIDQCIAKYPKFDSFLKAGQTNKEFRKQTFQELLINPIQRLPRIELYLRTLLERTDKLHPDYKLLNEALDTIICVNKKINFEKKKTEGQMELFDLLNDIEDCPATLLSANRHFIAKCDAKLIIQNSNSETENCIQRLDNSLFSLLLFTDWILLCKKRVVKRSNSLKDRTPNIPLSVSKKSKKTYRYIETIELVHIKCLYHDFEEPESLPDYADSFAMITFADSQTFRTYPFVVKDLEVKKQDFISDLVDAVEKLNELFNKEEFLKRGAFKDLDFIHSKSIARSLNKSKYVFMRTKERLNRTFSMRRNPQSFLSVSMENLSSAPLPSPSSSRLYSKVMNFLTPKENDNMFSNNSPVPSFNHIAELDNSDEVDDNFSLPATPAPARKKKIMYQGDGGL